ncbi:MAG: AAA family ATPase [Candidatus Latescibacteria bacterium]|nr:AAA family ATPase [Candidatus Latescibacterota bacterium]
MPPGSKTERQIQLIALAGPSCAGKTTLAAALCDRLGAQALPLDAYYRDFAALSASARAAFNFDAPAAIDRDRLERDLRQWAAGEAIEIPIYDFTTHARLAQTKRLLPGTLLVVEGLFALYWPTINALYHCKIFIDAPAALCLTRRLARDTAERGRSPTSIRAQYRAQVRPSYERYVAPTAKYADVRLDGREDPSVQVAAILARSA